MTKIKTGTAVDQQHLDALPLFPLSATVLFPHTLLPLHVFEPRYRRLAAYCVEKSAPLGLVLLRPGFERHYHGRPPLFEVGGLARIVRYHLQPDGRYNLLLIGVSRFRIEQELAPNLPFRLAQVRLLGEIMPPKRDPEVKRAYRELRTLALALLPESPELARLVLDLLAAARDPAVVAHTLVTLCIDNPLVAQRILELPAVADRLQQAVEGVVTRLGRDASPTAQ